MFIRHNENRDGRNVGDCAAVFNVMDELIDTLRITAPRVYSGVMRKISAL